MGASPSTRSWPRLRRGRDPQLAGRRSGPITGSARLGRSTKHLVKRLGPSDIAVIDHTDLDRIAAEELIATRVPAVINVARYSTGRYPNAGPLMLAEAGVVVVDAAGAPLFDQLQDGEAIDVEHGSIYARGERLVQGQVLSPQELSDRLEEQREHIDEALAAFAENTAEYARREGGLLTDAIDFPITRTGFRDRHALIVVRGAADGTAPGRERLERMELAHEVVPAPGTSQDVAMLLAFEKGASLIVSVGAHFNLVDFLDRGRDGMSSTFLTRLRIGDRLVDAKGVGRLYRPGASRLQLALFVAAVAILLGIVVVSSPALANLLELFWLKVQVLLGL